MLAGFRSLALETWFLERAVDFYATHLDLAPTRSGESEAVFDVGGDDLVLRAPGAVPRGGLHVHYALATDAYEDHHDRLSGEFDLQEHDFGDARSLYFYDHDDHCVELGSVGDARLDGVFEVVLEVEDLAPAEAFYTDLGFEPVDRGTDRERVRLRGPVDLELWEPQRGIADARGAVHGHLAFAGDPGDALDAVGDRACSVARPDPGSVRDAPADAAPLRLQDPDGHYLTVY